MTPIIIASVLAVGLALYFIIRHLRKAPIIGTLFPLPHVEEDFPRQFAPWASDLTGMPAEEAISKHDLFWHVPENYGMFWKGMRPLCAPSMTGEFEASTIQAGVDKRNRLKALNPDLKLFVQIGYAEGSDETTDFPLTHAWWKRDAQGNRIPGWGTSFLFNLDLPQVRQHVADCCLEAMRTHIWDGVMLDVFYDAPNHVDILKQVREKCGNWPIIVNLNYKIAPSIAPLVDGVFMECGSLSTAKQWTDVQEALDFNERHVRQPSMNCLQIYGYRVDIETMRAIVCLMLTRGNGYAMMSDVGSSNHDWYLFYDAKLGSPRGTTRPAGSIGSQRDFTNGTAVYNPPNGAMITLTFEESRLNWANGFRSKVHQLNPHDGGIYLK